MNVQPFGVERPNLDLARPTQVQDQAIGLDVGDLCASGAPNRQAGKPFHRQVVPDSFAAEAGGEDDVDPILPALAEPDDELAVLHARFDPVQDILRGVNRE